MIDFSRNHFELLGLRPRFRIDDVALERAYRALQLEVHPDKHASAADADRRLALQASARVNEAHDTLRDPVARAQYLLSLHGIAPDERDTALPIDFLERALERREAVADAAAAADERTLETMLNEVRAECRVREHEIAELLDVEQAWEAARQRVRELRFLTKLADDIDFAIAEAEA